MKTATFVLKGDLPFFIASSYRAEIFTTQFRGSQSVKHLIEAAGIPHTEVAQIIANHHSVDLGYIVEDNDLIEVSPYGSEPGADSIVAGDRSASDPACSTQFILDNHLGKLTTYLRILGFDCWYDHHLADKELAEAANHEQRILLTRDRRLLMRKVLVSGYCLRSLVLEEQVVEVLNRFRLYDKIKPFHRCLSCNALLEPIDKEAILDRLLPLTRKYYDEFQYCKKCDQVYWRGSHYEKMYQFVQTILDDNSISHGTVR